MKKVYNYTFKLVCIYVLILSIFSVSTIKQKVDHYTTNIQNVNQDKALKSSLLVQNHQEKYDLTEEESIKDVESQEEVSTDIKEEIVVEATPKPPVLEVVNIVDTSSFAVLSQETIDMSHYGHDCYGCTTGHTASGYYVGDGRIYYQDPTFGSVRVVAADSKYPLGTILRLGYHGTSITAIVLDRGGGIGDGKKFQIDLLTSSENKANELGIVKNTSLEVLRLGY